MQYNLPNDNNSAIVVLCIALTNEWEVMHELTVSAMSFCPFVAHVYCISLF